MERERFFFRPKSTYRGETDYEVYDRETGEEFRMSYLTKYESYEDYKYNGSKEEYERDVVGALHYLRKSNHGHVSMELVDAFVKHLQDDWDKWLEYAKNKIENDRDIGADIYGKYGPACPLVRGGADWDHGWHLTATPTMKGEA